MAASGKRRVGGSAEEENGREELDDEKAETVLKTFPGGDPVELGRARELASHYRWRSKMFDPDTYADRVKNEHTGANGGAIKIEDVRPPIADLIAGVKVTRPNG